MKTGLNIILPETAFGVKRNSLVIIDEFVYWLSKNKPDAYKDAIKNIGEKICKNAFNDLQENVTLFK